MPFSAAVLIAAVTAQVAPWGDGRSQPEDLRVTLVTFGPGDTLTEWWGHTALVVEDLRLHQQRLYNYGMFGFSTGFVHKFVQGRLEFWVADTPAVKETFEWYARELNRDVRLQELNFTPDEAMVIAKALADNVRPENATYLYHHYNDNCSTRPRDFVDRAFGGALLGLTSNAPARMSLRLQTRRYSHVNPVMLLVLDYLQNDELDRPIHQKEEAFLPDELERQLDALSLTRPDGEVVPAVRRKAIYYAAKNRPPVPEQAPDWTLQLILVGLALGGGAFGLVAWGRGKKAGPRVLLGVLNLLLGLSWGALGVFLFIVGTWTDHTVAHRNENLFLINPVTFCALPLGVMLLFNSRRARAGLRWTWTFLAATAVLGVLVKVLPRFDQNNWNLIALCLPANVGLAAAFWREQGPPAAKAKPQKKN